MHPTSERRTTRRSAVYGAGLLAAALVTSPASTPAAAAAAPELVEILGHEALAATNPGGIALDPAGSVYVANTGNDSVAKYLAGQTQPVWTAGDRHGGQSFTDPRDVAVLNGRVYVAEPGGVKVLDAANGAFMHRLNSGFRVPIGISTGNTPTGSPLLLVSDGNSGNVEIFNAQEQKVRSIPPLDPNAGTRDADTDSAGNVYVADYRNDRINKYSPTGTLLQQWGGSGGQCYGIPRPYGVEVDDADRVFVAASNNNLVRSYSATGQCLRTYGTSGAGPGQLSQLRRVAVGPGSAPKVYAADLWGLKVLVFNFDGTLASPLWRIGDGTYPAPGGLNEVPAVAVDGTAVYATDLNGHRITVWPADGSAVRTFGRKGRAAGRASFNWPMGLGLDPRNGRVWVGDTHSDNIKEFPPGGSDVALRQFAGVAGAPFNFPSNVAVDGSGNIYVADSSGSRVRAYTAGLAARWTATGIPQATGIAWDPVRNRVLVTSTGATPVFALAPATGARTAFGPGAGSGPGQLSAPRGVAVDAAGAVWVGDTLNHRVQKFRGDGTWAGVAFGGYGRGPLQFNRPMGVDVGPDGLLYVADSFNSRVQVVDVAGL